MVECTACHEKSTLDSKFCRACGSPLEAAALDAARAECEELLDQGVQKLEEGHASEALLIAEEVIADDPSNAAAYALKGDAHERMGSLVAALDAYEKVVALNPDSRLDRIRLTHLRQVLETAGTPSDAAGARKRAGFAAVAATVLVACVGSAIALTRSGATQTVTDVQGPATQPAVSQPATNPGDAGGRLVPQPKSEPTAETPATKPVPAGDSLPQAQPNGSVANQTPIQPMPLGPIKITPDGGGSVPSANPTRTTDPDPQPVAKSSPTDKPNKPKTVSVIDIKPSNSGGEQNGKNEPSPGDAANLIRVARQRQATGDYSGAADAYEKALAAGADAGSANQRLAQCYDKLGRKAEAKEAYRRAITALEAKVARGDGSAQAALDSCRAALSVLGG